MLRTARALLLAVVLTACDDGAPAPAGPRSGTRGTPGPVAAAPDGTAAPRAPDAPPEAWVDDDAVVAAVLAAARAGAPLPDVFAKLPPRVSPVRVAARVLHDHFAATDAAPADWAKLLAALDDLALGERTGVDRGALAALVAAWRAWTVEQRAAEQALTVRYATALRVLQDGAAPDLAALAVATEAAPGAPPPSSPAHACVLALRTVHAALATPGETMSPPVADALRDARAAFDALGWPGGVAPFLEIAADGLERRDGKTSFRAMVLWEQALGAYLASGDALRAGVHRLRRVAHAERDGEILRATDLAETALQQIAATGARGREPAEAATRWGTLALATRPDKALAAFDRALAEIAFAGGAPRHRAAVGERRATALWLLGRFDDAVAAADDAARALGAAGADAADSDLAGEIEWTAGQALADAARPADAVARFRASAEAFARAGRPERAAGARIRAAAALAADGRRDEARKIAADVLSQAAAGLEAQVFAVGVLRDLGELDTAADVLARMEAAGGDAVRDRLQGERARLAAARGDFAAARSLFAAAVKRAAAAGAREVAARLCLDAARMEQRAGDLEDAMRLAGDAITHLLGTPWIVEIDRARKIAADSARRRLFHYEADQYAAARLEGGGPPGTAATKLDAALDLLLVRLELASARPSAARAEAARAAAAALPEGPLRTAAQALVATLDGAPAAAAPSDAPPAGRGALLAEAVRLRDATDGELLAFAGRVPGEEPELRRWALRRVALRDGAKDAAIDWVAFLDRFRGDDPATTAALRAALAPDERFVALEPLGGRSLLVTVDADGARPAIVPGDLGLTAWWDAVHNEPTPRNLADAARAVSQNPAVVAMLGDLSGKRLVLSIGAPFGPLPGDMLTTTVGGAPRELIDVCAVDVARSPSEYVAAARRARPAGAGMAFLRSAFSPLRDRHAAAPILHGVTEDAARRRFRELLEEALRTAPDASAAVRAAKLALRAEWKPGPRPSLPSWAAFALRGAR